MCRIVSRHFSAWGLCSSELVESRGDQGSRGYLHLATERFRVEVMFTTTAWTDRPHRTPDMPVAISHLDIHPAAVVVGPQQNWRTLAIAHPAIGTATMKPIWWSGRTPVSSQPCLLRNRTYVLFLKSTRTNLMFVNCPPGSKTAHSPSRSHDRRHPAVP